MYSKESFKGPHTTSLVRRNMSALSLPHPSHVLYKQSTYTPSLLPVGLHILLYIRPH